MSLTHAEAADDAAASRLSAGDGTSVVRSEEHLRAGTVVVESGRVRLRKFVTTEMETITVPVRREHVVLEELPRERAGVGDVPVVPGVLSDEPVLLAELVLSEERPTVGTVVVPVERVRLWLETHLETEHVAAEVRQEQVEVVVDR